MSEEMDVLTTPEDKSAFFPPVHLFGLPVDWIIYAYTGEDKSHLSIQSSRLISLRYTLIDTCRKGFNSHLGIP